MRRKNKARLIVTGLIPLVLLLGVAGYLTLSKSLAPEAANKNTGTSTPDPASPTTKPAVTAGFNKNLHSIDSPESIWVVVNKKRPLPADFAPVGLVNHPLEVQLSPKIVKALDVMLSSARDESISLKIISGYRSYGSQAKVYNGYVQSDGQATADTYSARPGHSEHQTGLAVDLGTATGSCDLQACFGDTTAGKWLAAHAHEHGFIIRYPKGKDAIVGYQYEPWHIRYVGPELAAELAKTGQTMEEFFALTPAPAY